MIYREALFVQLTVRDVSRIFGVSQKTVCQWVREKDLPALFVQKHYRFNPAEILEWAASRGICIKDTSTWRPKDSADVKISLRAALEAGGIFYDIEGSDKASVLQTVIRMIHLPAGVSREMLERFVLAREAMASTGIGDGIAIPHPRNPIVLHVEYPVVGLCFLKEPVEFGALDGRKVDILFTVVTPNVRTHLKILARLSFVLQDAVFKALLKEKKSPAEMLEAVGRFEREEEAAS